MYISIDVGGTNTRVACSGDLINVSGETRFDTPPSTESLREKIINTVSELCGNEPRDGVCVGVPGIIDRLNNKFGRIINLPHLSYLGYEELIGSDLTGGVCLFQNDASLGGLGEAIFGSGKDHEIVGYLTLSTGVGGVRIASKKIDPSQKYSEPGHMIIQKDGRYFEMCGQFGCLSSYVSGTAFSEIYGVSPSECEDSGVWAEYGKNLAIGLINLMTVWSPDIFILGGSMVNKYDEYYREPLLRELEKQDLFQLPPIVKSALGDSSGLMGGFALLSQYFENV